MSTDVPMDMTMMVMQLLSDDTKVSFVLNAELARIKSSLQRPGCSAIMKGIFHQPQVDGLTGVVQGWKTFASLGADRTKQVNGRKRKDVAKPTIELSIKQLMQQLIAQCTN